MKPVTSGGITLDDKVLKIFGMILKLISLGTKCVRDRSFFIQLICSFRPYIKHLGKIFHMFIKNFLLKKYVEYSIFDIRVLKRSATIKS